MHVTIQYKDESIGLDIASPRAKLYAVPTSYSKDGLALEQWGIGDLEPVPACKIGDETLLAHFVIDGDAVNVAYLGVGVTYAAQ